MYRDGEKKGKKQGRDEIKQVRIWVKAQERILIINPYIIIIVNVNVSDHAVYSDNVGMSDQPTFLCFHSSLLASYTLFLFFFHHPYIIGHL